MDFSTPLYEARLIRRYKRFLADVIFEEGPDRGQTVTIHCPNPGSMMGLARPGARIFASRSNNPRRKLAYTYELEAVDGPGPACLVGINTQHPNRLAEEALCAGLLLPPGTMGAIRREQAYGTGSRIDLLVEPSDPAQQSIYIEVKNVHLMREAGHLEFPDSVTSRGAKHLRELAAMVAQGHRAIMLFVAQWPGARSLGIAGDIDPAYARALTEAMHAGVEVQTLDCDVRREAITPKGSIAFVAP